MPAGIVELPPVTKVPSHQSMIVSSAKSRWLPNGQSDFDLYRSVLDGRDARVISHIFTVGSLLAIE